MGTAGIGLFAVEHVHQGVRDAYSDLVEAHLAGCLVRTAVVADLQPQQLSKKGLRTASGTSLRAMGAVGRSSKSAGSTSGIDATSASRVRSFSWCWRSSRASTATRSRIRANNLPSESFWVCRVSRVVARTRAPLPTVASNVAKATCWQPYRRAGAKSPLASTSSVSSMSVAPACSHARHHSASRASGSGGPIGST